MLSVESSTMLLRILQNTVTSPKPLRAIFRTPLLQIAANRNAAMKPNMMIIILSNACDNKNWKSASAGNPQ